MFKKMLQRNGLSSLVTLGAIVLVAGFAAPAQSAESVDDMFAAASKAMNSGQNKEAIRILTRAAQAAPNDPEVLVMRARAYTSDGDHTRALADATKAIELKPDDVEMYLARIRVLRADDKFEKAMEDAQKAVELAPNNSDVFLARADIYRDMGNDAAAKADEDKADAIDKAAR